MFSLLDSTIKPQQLVQRAKELGQTSIALTDHGNTYGCVLTYKLCKKHGIKFIYGTEGYICDDVSVRERKMYHLVLLAKNETGRLNLNELLTKAKVEHFYYKPRFDFELLKQHKDGLIVLSACMGGELQRHLAEGDYALAKEMALKYKQVFGEDYYIEVQSHTDTLQQSLNKQLVQLAKECEIQWVATSDAHYLNPTDQELHSIFVQIAQDRDAGEVYTDCYLQSEDDVYKILSTHLSIGDIDVAVRNTTVIADKCNADIPLSPPQIPHNASLPKGFNSELAYLKHLCNEGWVLRDIHKLSQAEQDTYRERLYYEMNAIERMGFDGYYLLVHSYVNSVKRRGIARGSGGGSLVAYLINIIDIDPVKYGLYFERFIDVGQLELLETGQVRPEEIKMPDFDTDFGEQDREKVIQFIIDKYGQDKVASLGSFQYIWDRTAIKDVGRVLGIPFEETNVITKLLDIDTIEEALEAGTLSVWVTKYPKLFEYAKQLAGLPKSFGKHPCGKVITMKDLNFYCPVSENKGEMVLELDMDDAESLGLVKVDALVLRTVDVIYDTLDMIGKDYSYISPQTLDFFDNNVLQDFSNGHTVGVFQFESDGMIDVLQKMQPTGLDDLAVANALYRPGSIRYIDDYIGRKHGTQSFDFLHPDLEPILESTFGIIIFQEQLIEIGRLAQMRNPDLIRKATGRKDAELMAQVEPELRKGLSARGWTEEQMNELWDTMVEFSKYSFNKSHSYAYSMIAYISAYLKHYHPKEFVCALINSYADKLDEVPKCVQEATRLGFDIVVDVYNHPTSLCKVADGNITLGTKLIKYCNEQNAIDLAQLGKHDNFIDLLIDIAENTSINSRQLRIFILLNAFKEFGNSGRLIDILSEFEGGKNRYRKTHKEKTKEKRIIPLKELEATISDREITMQEQLAAEREYLGFITSTYEKADDNLALVLDVDTKYSPRITVYYLKNGEEKVYKMQTKRYYGQGGEPFCTEGDMIAIRNIEERAKMRKEGKKWIEIGGTDEWLTGITVYKK